MTRLLIDASVMLAAFDPEDDQHDDAAALLVDGQFTLATLDLARYEVANVAVRAWRAPASVRPLLATIDRIADDGGVISSSRPLLSLAAELAEAHGISVYDAAYVAVVAEHGHRLVSCDKRDLVSKDLAVLPDSLVRSG
jgi:predicted nucleic acid-binding protein